MITLARPNFQQFTNNTFSQLSFDQDFTDVTLACDDGQLVKAHKVILAAASSFFKTILSQAPHPNPLVHIQGVKVHHLKLMLEFIYLGRAGVESEDLEDFFETTRRLKIEGMEEVLEEECRGRKSSIGEDDENLIEENGEKEAKVEKVKVCSAILDETQILEEAPSTRESVIVFSQLTQAKNLEDGLETEISDTLENDQVLETEKIEIETTGKNGFVTKTTVESDEQMQENIVQQLQEDIDDQMQETIGKQMPENIDANLQGGDLIEKSEPVEEHNDEQWSQVDVSVKHEKIHYEENLLYEENVDHEKSLNLDDADNTESIEKSDASVSDGQVDKKKEDEKNVAAVIEAESEEIEVTEKNTEKVKEEEFEEIEEVTDLPALDQWGYARPLNLSFLPDPEVILDLEDSPCEIAASSAGQGGKVDLVDKLREKETKKMERKYNLRNRREANLTFANGKSKRSQKGKADFEPKKVKRVELNPFHDESAFEDDKKFKKVKEAKTNAMPSINNNKQVSIKYIPTIAKKMKTGDLKSQKMSLPRRRTRSATKALQVFHCFYQKFGFVAIIQNIGSRKTISSFRKMLSPKRLSNWMR